MGTNFSPGHNNSWTALWAFGPPFRPPLGPPVVGPSDFEGRPRRAVPSERTGTMKDSKKQIELKFEVGILPPPTIPPVSWEEARESYGRGPVVGDPQNAAEYFRKYIGGRAKEAFLTMYLDHRNHVLDVVLNNEGT